MWSPDMRTALQALAKVGAVLPLAAALGGCFQPVYGERSITGGPGLRASLAAVEVAQIPGPPGSAQARLAVELRNEINYYLTQGTSPLPPTHRLTINLSTSGQQLIVDPSTARGEFEVVAVNASYNLTEIATSKQVMSGSATARTSYDIPGQQQRYAALRGQRESQTRATKIIAEQIRNRLASYFAAGS